eukprot:CAMPEP_0172326636 /NCGR_PEP_ID=MMETSP1058-20130122/57139_1 /TAXON_ID=83371 /ORGANISM="Detonula confervacea, Strain CCMP 353" /LENGTH=358 /DNA_ID=CAMNT_0013043469 /DNA_START=149 /DNA_END=1221 /DNA_ORIENTATION=+
MNSLKRAFVVVSLLTTCQSFNTIIHSPARNRVDNSGLHLFDSLLQKEGSKSNNGQQRRSSNGSSSTHRIPNAELDFLGSGFGLGNYTTPPFPYPIELTPPPPNSKKSRIQPSRLIIRHLEDVDITNILPEVVREFGALAPMPTNEPGDELATKIENFLFSLTILIGLTQRVVRREKGYSISNSACPDHNVICLVEQIPNNNNGEEISYSEQIVGIAELSWQPPNPNGNAPPFVLPYFMKTLISRYAPSREGTDADAPVGYVSNVLVWKTRRGRGYGRVLMAALEGIGKMWGCEDVRLHVDANEYSGRIARGLYWGLGYEGVPDRGLSKNNKVSYEWMGTSMANQGLYLVDGVPLLYLR